MCKGNVSPMLVLNAERFLRPKESVSQLVLESAREFWHEGACQKSRPAALGMTRVGCVQFGDVGIVLAQATGSPRSEKSACISLDPTITRYCGDKPWTGAACCATTKKLEGRRSLRSPCAKAQGYHSSAPLHGYKEGQADKIWPSLG